MLRQDHLQLKCITQLLRAFLTIRWMSAAQCTCWLATEARAAFPPSSTPRPVPPTVMTPQWYLLPLLEVYSNPHASAVEKEYVCKRTFGSICAACSGLAACSTCASMRWTSWLTSTRSWPLLGSSHNHNDGSATCRMVLHFISIWLGIAICC